MLLVICAVEYSIGTDIKFLICMVLLAVLVEVRDLFAASPTYYISQDALHVKSPIL